MNNKEVDDFYKMVHHGHKSMLLICAYYLVRQLNGCLFLYKNILFGYNLFERIRLIRCDLNCGKVLYKERLHI